jgi:hypothetical protein
MGLMMGVMTIDTVGGGILAVQSLIALLFLAVGFGLGWGLLTARQWARWTAIALAALAGIASIGALVALIAVVVSTAALDSHELDKTLGLAPPTTAPGQPAPEKDIPFSGRNFIYGILTFYGFPFVVSVLLHGAVVWVLLRRRVGEWFRFARELRAEHRRVRQELAT